MLIIFLSFFRNFFESRKEVLHDFILQTKDIVSGLPVAVICKDDNLVYRAVIVRVTDGTSVEVRM